MPPPPPKNFPVALPLSSHPVRAVINGNHNLRLQQALWIGWYLLFKTQYENSGRPPTSSLPLPQTLPPTLTPFRGSHNKAAMWNKLWGRFPPRHLVSCVRAFAKVQSNYGNKFQAGTVQTLGKWRILAPPFSSALAKLQTANVGFVMSVRPHGTRIPMNVFSWTYYPTKCTK